VPGLVSEYRRFHGKDPDAAGKIRFDVPRGMVLIGRAVAVEYECSKWHGGGDGRKAVYRHKFGPGAILCMDEKHRRQLYIIGTKVKVTAAGIEH